MLNHLIDGRGDFIGQQIRYPNDPAPVRTGGEHLQRRVMVGQRLAARRPRVSARLVIDVDDELTYGHSIREGDDSRVTFEFAIHDEPRHQAPVNVGRDQIRLNLQITSPRRAADKLKFLAGSESAMGAFIGDIVPEAQAAFIRDGIARA